MLEIKDIMRRISWFAVGVILLFVIPIANGVVKWKRGKPLANIRIVAWISFCLPWLGIALDAGMRLRELRAFVCIFTGSGVYFLLIHPLLFGRRE
jgi:hypothetical protein